MKKEDELIHKSIQEEMLSQLNRFSNQFLYDQFQDFQQESLTFVDIHRQIDSLIKSDLMNQHLNQFTNQFKNWFLVVFLCIDH